MSEIDTTSRKTYLASKDTHRLCLRCQLRQTANAAQVCDQCVAEARSDQRRAAADVMTEKLAPVISGINAMSSSAGDALALAVMREHPTLAGQLGRGVALGIMRAVMGNPDWKPYDSTIRKQPEDPPMHRACMIPSVLSHPDHDGRFSCELVIGAELMARQGFV